MEEAVADVGGGKRAVEVDQNEIVGDGVWRRRQCSIDSLRSSCGARDPAQQVDRVLQRLSDSEATRNAAASPRCGARSRAGCPIWR